MENYKSHARKDSLEVAFFETNFFRKAGTSQTKTSASGKAINVYLLQAKTKS